MKKIAIVFIAILLLLLTACTKSHNPLFDLNGISYSSENFEFLTEKESYSSSDTVIRYTIKNISDENAGLAGDKTCFTLHKLVDGEWKRVGTKEEHAWTSIGLILPPNQTEVREINLENYFNLPLDKGTYRIAVESLISNTFEIN